MSACGGVKNVVELVKTTGHATITSHIAAKKNAKVSGAVYTIAVASHAYDNFICRTRGDNDACVTEEWA